jgi:putative hydrolase of the HAD superfamily
MQPFKNLIFDLGEVIIDIDYRQTITAFQKLAVVDFSTVVSYSAQNPVFDWYEKGQVTTGFFFDELRKYLRPGTTDKEIESAWNAIFQDFSPQKIELLKQLKTRYNTFALSNINEIHLASIDKAAQTKFGGAAFSNFFQAAYYSNKIGLRKPEPEIYALLLEKEGLKAGETFFVDDKKENVEAARTLGIHAYQLTNRNNLQGLLAELKII